MDLSSAGFRFFILLIALSSVPLVRGQGNSKGKGNGKGADTDPTIQPQGTGPVEEDDPGNVDATPCGQLPLTCNVGERFPRAGHCKQFYECQSGNKWKNTPCRGNRKYDSTTETCVESNIYDETTCFRCGQSSTQLPPTNTPTPEPGNDNSGAGSEVSTKSRTQADPLQSACNLPPSVCPRGLLLPDPKNCSQYQECLFNRWLKRPCPPGTKFDALTLRCHHANLATCHHPCPTEPTTTPLTTPLPPPNSRLECILSVPCLDKKVIAKPDDCSAYLSCFSGQFWTEVQCPESRPFFDWRINNCVKASASYECAPPCGSATLTTLAHNSTESPSPPTSTSFINDSLTEPPALKCSDVSMNLTIDELCASIHRIGPGFGIGKCTPERSQTSMYSHMHPNNCSKNFMCIGTVWMPGTCSSGYRYNRFTCACEPEDQVECVVLKCDGSDKALGPAETGTTSSTTITSTSFSTPTTAHSTTPSSTTTKSPPEPPTTRGANVGPIQTTTGARPTRSRLPSKMGTTVKPTPPKNTRMTTGLPPPDRQTTPRGTKATPQSTSSTSSSPVATLPNSGTSSTEVIATESSSTQHHYMNASHTQMLTNITTESLLTTMSQTTDADEVTGVNTRNTTTTTTLAIEETPSSIAIVTSPSPSEKNSPTKMSSPTTGTTQTTTGKPITLTSPPSTSPSFTQSNPPISVTPISRSIAPVTKSPIPTTLLLTSTASTRETESPLSNSPEISPPTSAQVSSTPTNHLTSPLPQTEITPSSATTLSSDIPTASSSLINKTSSSYPIVSTNITSPSPTSPTTILSSNTEAVTETFPTTTSSTTLTVGLETDNTTTTNNQSSTPLSTILEALNFTTSIIPPTTSQATFTQTSTATPTEYSTLPLSPSSPDTTLVTNSSKASASASTAILTTEETSFPNVDNSSEVTPTPVAGITNATTEISANLSTTKIVTTTTANFEPSTTLEIPQYCEDNPSGSHLWKRTQGGSSRDGPCPGSMAGMATRRCGWRPGSGATWEDPDYSLCVSKPYKEISRNIEEIKNIPPEQQPGKPSVPPLKVEETITELTRKVKDDVDNSDGLTGGDLNVTLEALDVLTELADTMKFNFTDTQTMRLANTAGYVLSKRNKDGWEAVRQREPERGAVIMKTVDRIAEQMSKKLPSGNKMTLFVPNLEIERSKPDTWNDTHSPSISNRDNITLEIKMESMVKESAFSFEFKPLPPPGTPPTGMLDKIYLDQATIAALGHVVPGRTISMWSTYYATLNEFLPTNDEELINSRILSLSVLNLPEGHELNPSVTLHFSSVNGSIDAEAMCKYWQFSRGGGEWDDEGCKVISNNASGTVCQCNHLTNFAVLMSPYPLDGMHETILSLISVIGCLLSILGMIITICLYILSWKRVKSHHAAVLINLCIALIIANTVFLAGINRTENQMICMAVAGMLHFFYLVAFFMMFADGVQFILYVVQVFHVRRKKETFLLILTCWFLPAVIVAITMSITKGEGYGTDDYCWLRKDNGLIAAFVAPALLVMIVNFCILCVILRTIANSKGSERKNRVKATIWNIAVMMPLLGLTWVFGLFSVNDETIYFQYIFAICNSLQGFFIFFFHCALNKKMRQAVVERFSTRSSQSSSLRKSAGSNKSDKKNAVTKKTAKKNKKPYISRPQPIGRTVEYINPQTTNSPQTEEPDPEPQYMELDDPVLRPMDTKMVEPPNHTREMSPSAGYHTRPMAHQTPGHEHQHLSFTEEIQNSPSNGGEPHYENSAEYAAQAYHGRGIQHLSNISNNTQSSPLEGSSRYGNDRSLHQGFDNPQFIPDEVTEMSLEVEKIELYHPSLEKQPSHYHSPSHSLPRLPYSSSHLQSLDRQNRRNSPINSLERVVRGASPHTNGLDIMRPGNSLERLHYPKVSLEWTPHHIPRPHVHMSRPSTTRKGLPRISLSMDDLTSIGQGSNHDNTNPWMPVAEDPYLSPVSLREPVYDEVNASGGATFDPRMESRRSPYLSDSHRRLGQNSVSLENLDQLYIPRRNNESAGGISTNSMYRFASREKGSAYIILEPELEYSTERLGPHGHNNEEEPIYMQIDNDTPMQNSGDLDYRIANA